MLASNSTILWKSFLGRYIFPTAVTIALFITSFFLIIIPAIEKNSMDRKREMIRELTNSAWNILAKLENDERKGLLTRKLAQAQAVEQFRNLHYGQEMKDYFWINDMHPRMIIHPYRTDLNGKDLSNYTDPEGKRVFVEFVRLVKSQGAGYVDYMWQWKDDEKRIEPKISYVKGFMPWGWIIGTGVYIDDVKTEIDTITRSLIEISLFILAVIALLLVSIIKQSYTNLKLQQHAENALRESEEKYRTLVESAAEGMLMALEGRYMYANRTIADFLEYSIEEFSRMQVSEIFSESDEKSGYQYIHELIAGKSIPESFETKLKSKSGVYKDVILSATQISIGEKKGFMAVITDITKRKLVENALGESEEKFRSLANNLNVGIFRRTIGKNPKFIEVNPALVKLLGYSDKEDLYNVTIPNFYKNPEDPKNFDPMIFPEGLKRDVVKLKRKDGTTFDASVWEVIVKDEDNNPQYFDGIVEDITEIVAKEKELERLLSEMQTALMFFNQQLGNIPHSSPIICLPTATIKEAADLMERQNTDVLLIRDDSEKDCGVVTDHDLRKVLNMEDIHFNSPVSAIMSSPIHTLPIQSHVFESWLAMELNNISHLFITELDGEIVGLIHIDDLLSARKYSPAVLLWEIKNASTPEDIIKRNAILPYLITILINSGAKPQNINHLTTIVVDTILQKFIEFSLKELGEPPAKFSFIVFGSEGRQEQTLRTDQDNAIVFENVEPELRGSVQSYFLQLGTKVCGWLNLAGYTYCDGNNMAQNPEWCQPVSVWKKYFNQWINSASSEDLLRVKIFFDFRSGFGEQAYAKELREYLDEILPKNPRFFQLFVRNVLPWSPPLSIFGNIVVESVGDNRKAFDIKSSMMPIVDYARIYALNNKIWATNTMERLNALLERNILNYQNYQEIAQAYTYLMQIRLRVQAEALTHGNKTADNYVSPKNLTYIEQKLLKEIFLQIKNFQSGLSYTFTGQVGGA